MSTLLLRLAAPLQSWGTGSYFDNRKTDYYPSKSGVIGMIAAAMGRARTDDLSDLRALRFGIRIDYGGKIIDDFQVTKMGEKLNSNLSHREYLSDAIFLVGFESENTEFLNEIVNALKNPVFTIFLGRKSCPPTEPVVLDILNDDLYTSLFEEEWLMPDWRRSQFFNYNNQKAYLRIITEEATGNSMVKDNPKSFNSNRREYEYRILSEKKAKIIENPESIYSTNQDFMKGIGD